MTLIFKKERKEKEMKKLNSLILACRESIRRLDETVSDYIHSHGNTVSDTKAEAYVGEAVKILIAVVIGALLLTLTYTLMKDTVFATVTKKITDLFGYTKTPTA